MGKRIWIGPSQARWETVPWSEGLFPVSESFFCWVVTGLEGKETASKSAKEQSWGAVFSLFVGWAFFSPSQIALDRFGQLCTACFKKLMLSVSRFRVERKEVVLNGQLIWFESNYPL